MNRKELVRRFMTDKDLKYSRKRAEVAADFIIGEYVEELFRDFKSKRIKALKEAV